MDTINAVPAAVDNTVNLGANAIRNAPSNAIQVVNNVPVAVNSAVTTVGRVPGQFVSFGNTAFNTIRPIPGNAIQTGATALRNTQTGYFPWSLPKSSIDCMVIGPKAQKMGLRPKRWAKGPSDGPKAHPQALRRS